MTRTATVKAGNPAPRVAARCRDSLRSKSVKTLRWMVWVMM